MTAQNKHAIRGVSKPLNTLREVLLTQRFLKDYAMFWHQARKYLPGGVFFCQIPAGKFFFVLFTKSFAKVCICERRANDWHLFIWSDYLKLQFKVCSNFTSCNKVADWVAIAMHFYSLDSVLSFGFGTTPFCHVTLLNDVVTGWLGFPTQGALHHPLQTLPYDVWNCKSSMLHCCHENLCCHLDNEHGFCILKCENTLGRPMKCVRVKIMIYIMTCCTQYTLYTANAVCVVCMLFGTQPKL